MSDITVSDLIAQAAEQQPEQFRTTFDELMMGKIAGALEVKKQEVASRYFNSGAPEEDTEDTITDEEQDGQDPETDA